MQPSINMLCPSCHGSLEVSELRCSACDIAMKGHFAANEFAGLSEEDLHFLRIFIRCEGHIREMESALGVSYPTIKARMAKLKAALTLQQKPAPTRAPARQDTFSDTLRELQAGTLTFEQALERIKTQEEKPL